MINIFYGSYWADSALSFFNIDKFRRAEYRLKLLKYRVEVFWIAGELLFSINTSQIDTSLVTVCRDMLEAIYIGSFKWSHVLQPDEFKAFYGLLK